MGTAAASRRDAAPDRALRRGRARVSRRARAARVGGLHARETPRLPADHRPDRRCEDGPAADAGTGSPDVLQRRSRSPLQMNSNSIGLAWTLIRTDFKTRFHGTLSGFVWALLKPAAMFLVLMSVFSFLFKDPTYKLQLVVGLFLWDFFAEGTRNGLAALHSKSFLFRQLRVPLWILVVAALANPFLTLTVFTMVIVLFLTAIGQPPSLAAVGLFAFYSVSMTLIVVGFSLGASV